MRAEQTGFGLNAMEALGRSAAGLGEADNHLKVSSERQNSARETRDSPGGGSNIFKKIRDPAN